MLDLKVINLWGAPGAGKSTTAAGLFNFMKTRGMRVEYVPEFAKDLTYSRRLVDLQNQLYVLGEQDNRLRRLVGHVEWAITDSPLPLCLIYATPEYSTPWFEAVVEGAYDRYDNKDFLIRRKKPYAAFGRNQTESEALAIDIQVRDLFETTVGEPQRGLIDGHPWAPLEIADRLGFKP